MVILIQITETSTACQENSKANTMSIAKLVSRVQEKTVARSSVSKSADAPPTSATRIKLCIKSLDFNRKQSEHTKSSSSYVFGVKYGQSTVSTLWRRRKACSSGQWNVQVRCLPRRILRPFSSKRLHSPAKQSLAHLRNPLGKKFISLSRQNAPLQEQRRKSLFESIIWDYSQIFKAGVAIGACFLIG